MSGDKKAFRKLIVWQRAHELTLLVYQVTRDFPKEEMFGLKSQLRRSAASVPANIAEGYALGSSGNYLRHLYIARGSLAETEYHLLLAHDLEYLSDTEYEKATDLCNETGYLLYRLISSIKGNS